MGTNWPELMTVEEVVDVLRVSRMTVYRMVNNGTIESIRIGRNVRIPHRAFEEYLNKARQAP